MPHHKNQQALEREKQNTSKLVSQNLNAELLGVAQEQQWQLGACALPSSTESESEAEEQERIRPKEETASGEVANISWQNAALLREAVFNTVPETVNVKRVTMA